MSGGLVLCAQLIKDSGPRSSTQTNQRISFPKCRRIFSGAYLLRLLPTRSIRAVRGCCTSRKKEKQTITDELDKLGMKRQTR